ncbi:MAG: U32 family peptidase [Pseudomonadota bacterium]|nr:U32 family peptidase [Pseudomonadota bacterium]
MPLPHHLELLSPARDAAIGIEAINHGADAVYIGGPGFGARAGAGNAVADIERLCRHAHRYNARIFITLNTILRDDELEDARRMAWQVYEAGADALIVQDMGLLMLDLPPIQLHASTQCDIRTPEKARFLQDAGFSQIVLARELDLPQIAAVRDALDPARPCAIEFFIHGALCVAYSGQCYISHAHTGRSANRGDCSQACRLPYQVLDAQGRFVAHDAHVLSMKDNNQSLNLGPLIDAGVRSFKIEGRYKDMGYVKNITAHYRRLLDEQLAQRPALARASSGSCTYSFTPDPLQNFNREFTDYFVNGRQPDIGAFDTPKNPGQPIGFVTRTGADHFDLQLDEPTLTLANGDGLCYWDAQKELVGAQTNRVESLGGGAWRIHPKDPMARLHDLRKGTVIHRNRSMDWVRTLEKKSADRRIGLWLALTETPDGLCLSATDEDGHSASAHTAQPHQPPQDPAQASAKLREALAQLGETEFTPLDIHLDLPRPWFVPASVTKQLRRDAIAALQAARAAAWQRLPRASAVQPPTPYPDDSLSYLANVFNHAARDFYARHGVKVIAAAYESQQEEGEVSLMITKHCVRYSLSLCPKQAKGVIGVKGTIRAEPLQLINGKEKLTLRFDCKPCEMHVVGKIKRSVLQHGAREATEHALRFYRQQPVVPQPFPE